MGRWIALELWSKLHPRTAVLNVNLVILICFHSRLKVWRPCHKTVFLWTVLMTADAITARWFLKGHSTPYPKNACHVVLFTRYQLQRSRSHIVNYISGCSRKFTVCCEQFHIGTIFRLYDCTDRSVHLLMDDEVIPGFDLNTRQTRSNFGSGM